MYGAKFDLMQMWPNFFQQCKITDANAKISCQPSGTEEEDNLNAAILSELKMFRR